MSSSHIPLLAEESGDGGFATDYEHLEKCSLQKRYSYSRWRVVIVGLACLVGGVIFGTGMVSWFSPSPGPRSRCSNPSLRMEWRSLSEENQDSYLSAVNCLRHKPSRLGLNQSLYDDFPYVHFRVGGYAHHSAAFIAWHRYFLHVYEEALRKECDYQGSLTYWDWSLDWHNLTASPIWSSSSFGTDGTGEATFLHGRCVQDGRFALMNLHYVDERPIEHCLSRGFADGTDLTGNGSRCSPTAVYKILNSDSFDEFNSRLEDGPHDAIPRVIRGDFSLLTAPSDPVFFLHHTNLDRLWRLWQESDWDHNSRQYNGPASHLSDQEANVEDVIPMGGLAPDVKVKDILDTQSGMLCYT